MKVTIVGAGNMGRAIGTRAVAGGHEVEIVANDPSHAQKLASELGGSATALEAGAPFGGEVVVFAVYYPGIKDAVRQYADQLAGKVVVDITNPVNFETFDSLVVPADGSATAAIAAALPQSRVVKAFNTTFAATLASGKVGDLSTTVLIAGDDAEAKSLVAEVVTAGGLRAIDAGSSRRARELEALGFLQITLAAAEKVAWTGGFAVAS